MAKNIEINILNSTNTYEVLYPKTLITNVTNGASIDYVDSKETAIKDAVKIKKETGSWKGNGTLVGSGNNLLLQTLNVSFTPDILTVGNKSQNLVNGFRYRLNYQSRSDSASYDSYSNYLVQGGDGDFVIMNLDHSSSYSEAIWQQVTAVKKYAVTHYTIEFTSTTVKIICTWSDFVWTKNVSWENDNDLRIEAQLNTNRTTYYWTAIKFYY